MKEQVVAPRGVRRSASQSKGFAQKPARRDGSAPRREFSFSPRALFAYLPKALKVVLGILIVITAIVGYRVAASASMFQVKTIDVSGASRTSAEEIQLLTRRALTRTGVWRADLNALSNELSRLPGVQRAVVTRVLPDGLRIRITERVPAAIVRTTAGHFIWVDQEGVALGEMKPEDQMPSFFIRGWDEDGTEQARGENAERVKKYLELSRVWSAAGLTERISEVTLNDLRDIRVQLAGADAQIEVRLGSQDGSRLKDAIEELDRYKQGGRGLAITYVAVQSGRVVLGTSSGNRGTTNADDGADAASTPSTDATEGTTNAAISKPAISNGGKSRDAKRIRNRGTQDIQSPTTRH